MASGYLLAQFGASSVSSGLPLDGVLYLIAAAYTVGDSRYFALFTRLLVLDNAVNYSTLIKHCVLASLPDSFLCRCSPPSSELVTNVKTVLVEEQRRAALTMLVLESEELGSKCCAFCRNYTRPSTLPTYFEASKFTRKQLGFHTAATPVKCKNLRKILTEAHKSDNVVLHNCRQATHTLVVSGTGLKEVCNMVSEVASGLCLICLQGVSDAGTCTHLKMLQRWTKDDPLS